MAERTFKIIKMNNRNISKSKRYSSNSPLNTIKKIFLDKLQTKPKEHLTIEIQEVGRDSDKKIYGPYHGYLKKDKDEYKVVIKKIKQRGGMNQNYLSRIEGKIEKLEDDIIRKKELYNAVEEGYATPQGNKKEFLSFLKKYIKGIEEEKKLLQKHLIKIEKINNEIQNLNINDQNYAENANNLSSELNELINELQENEENMQNDLQNLILGQNNNREYMENLMRSMGK